MARGVVGCILVRSLLLASLISLVSIITTYIRFRWRKGGDGAFIVQVIYIHSTRDLTTHAQQTN
jgi:hypothetical protein